MQEQETKTTQEISVLGTIKNEYLEWWGYKQDTEEAHKAWVAKFNHDESVSRISNPNRPHGRMYDLPSYQSPITGKWIDGRVQRREDLARSGCVEYDPGMKEEQAKRHAREDAELDRKVDAHVEETIYKMPTEKREKLAAELENSDVSVTRI